MEGNTPEPYSVSYSKDATRTMRRLPNNVSNTIDDKVSALATDPMAPNNNVTPLVAEPGSRLRVGDWRVLFELDHSQRRLRVRRVMPRQEGYRR